jgi:hypothetical protein
MREDGLPRPDSGYAISLEKLVNRHRAALALDMLLHTPEAITF